MSGERRMCGIHTGVEHRDFDWTIRSSPSVNLMRERQVNLFRRPLRYEHSVIASDAPGVTNAPRVTAAYGRFRNVIWFDKSNARVAIQLSHTVFNARVVSDAQSVDRAAAKLIDRKGIE